jgi:hypothetical protein
MLMLSAGTQKPDTLLLPVCPADFTQGHHRRYRLLASTAALALVSSLSAPSAPLVAGTDAAWQRTHTVQASLAAVTVPAARLTAPCRYVAGVLGLGARIEVFWLPPTTYNLDKAQVWASTSGLGSALAPLTGFSLQQNTRFDSAAGHYVTSVPTNLLGGLLGLGTELEISIVITEYGWTSRPASVATNAGLVANLGATCRNLA